MDAHGQVDDGSANMESDSGGVVPPALVFDVDLPSASPRVDDASANLESASGGAVLPALVFDADLPSARPRTRRVEELVDALEEELGAYDWTPEERRQICISLKSLIERLEEAENEQVAQDQDDTAGVAQPSISSGGGPGIADIARSVWSYLQPPAELWLFLLYRVYNKYDSSVNQTIFEAQANVEILHKYHGSGIIPEMLCDYKYRLSTFHTPVTQALAYGGYYLDLEGHIHCSWCNVRLHHCDLSTLPPLEIRQHAHADNCPNRNHSDEYLNQYPSQYE